MKYRICQICHERNYESQLWELVIEEMGKFRICEECHEKIKDLVMGMLENKGD